MSKNKQEIGKAIFGSFDGMTCVLGVIAAGVISGDTHALILASIGLCIAESVAMCGGSYLSEIVAVDRVKQASIIGVSAGIGVILPVLPFLIASHSLAIVGSAVMTLGMACAIAQARIESSGRIAAYVQTFAILLIAAIASILVTLALNTLGVAS